jgi:two-component system KDP operon response regulator KdpE
LKVLVVDDEPDVANLVAMGIAYHRPDYQIVRCHSGESALDHAAREPWDLVILDLTMPVVDGFTVLGALRGGGSDVPVIVLTARGAEQDRVRGLELGADDYVTKPFSNKELVARIDAVLRRYRAGTEASRTRALAHGDLRIDFAQRKVTVRGAHIALTPTEYNLLFQLATNAGRVLSHDELLKKVWGDEYRDEVHYLKVYVGRLRTKLERDPAKPELILTVRGVGYQFPAAVST